MRVNANNEMRFSATGTCGIYRVAVHDEPFFMTDIYPQWSGGCGYGPGPLPSLRIGISFSDPSGMLGGYRLTQWSFPDLVVGDNRVTAPYSVGRVVIRDILPEGYHGFPTKVDGIVGQGVILTRITGVCDVTSPSRANAIVAFVIYGQIIPNV